MLWMLAVVLPLTQLGLAVGEVLAVQPWHPQPIWVVGREERPVAATYEALWAAIQAGALLPLSRWEAGRCLRATRRRSHLHLVA